MELAKQHGGVHNIVVSGSQDAKKNPLSGEQKVRHAKRAFPEGANVTAATKDAPTILHQAAKMHAQGVQHLHVVAGSDRQKEMQDLLNKYNGKKDKHGEYNFKSITVHSSGARDPDSEGVEGMSASKMREHAASGNKTEFYKGASSKMSAKQKEEMYNDVRHAMGIKEMFVRGMTGKLIPIKKQVFRGADNKLHRAYPGKSASSGGGGGGGSGGSGAE